MHPTTIQSQEEAERYLARALGRSRKYRMFPFDLGWVAYPILSQEEIDRGRHIGLTKLVLDSRTGVITEFPSLPVETVAERYTTAIRDSTRMLGGQIYPPRTRLRLTLTRYTPDKVEYQIRPECLTEDRPTANYLLVMDKQSRIAQPPGTMNMMASSWIEARQRAIGIWPLRGIVEY